MIPFSSGNPRLDLRIRSNKPRILLHLSTLLSARYGKQRRTETRLEQPRPDIRSNHKLDALNLELDKRNPQVLRFRRAGIVS